MHREKVTAGREPPRNISKSGEMNDARDPCHELRPVFQGRDMAVAVSVVRAQPAAMVFASPDPVAR